MIKQRLLLVLVGLSLVFALPFSGTAFSADVDSLEEQLMLQQEQLETLQKQVEQFKKTEDAAPASKLVTSGSDKVKLTLSGQINRAMNVIDDGDTTEAYFVDSDASNSRFRLLGTVEVDDDWTIGTRLEIAVAPNESSDVSQDNAESGDFFDQRYTEITLASKQYGKIYFGKGDTASNNSAEVDLSGTDLVQYASIADIAAGMQFVESSSDDLTGTTVSDAFKDFDGLSRKSRLRYDTPVFNGFSLATSWISDKRWDASAWWNGKFSGFKAGAAAAVVYVNTQKNGNNSDYQYDGSFSIIHEETGLNATFSGGYQEVDSQGDPSNLWGKLGWRTDLVSYGKTSFGIDYASSENLATDGDDGYSYGLAAVQELDKFGAELYAQYRVFSLDRDDDPSVHDLHVATIGSRIKF
jgi:predicted porin